VSDFQLYVADAIDLMRALPAESVDLIITDVAYESLEKHRAVGTTTRLKESDASSNEWFLIFRNARFPEFFAEAMRVLKKHAHLYFYCDSDTAFVAKPIGEAAGFKFWKPIVWGKTRQGETPDADELLVEHQAMGMGYHYRSSYEFVLFFEKGKRKLNDLGVRDLLPFPTIRNGYPTEKPAELNRIFVRQSSEPGELVLDPFVGSGSTGVAALRNGRNFIGGDIKASAVEHARARFISNAATDIGAPLVIVEGARPPEPPPKSPKQKRKPKGPPTEKDRETMAEAGGTTVAELPMGAAEASRDLREAEEEAAAKSEGELEKLHPSHQRELDAGSPKPEMTMCRHGDYRATCILCQTSR
jgi:site-specific DNA-methyltransferase (adenine-specific)